MPRLRWDGECAGMINPSQDWIEDCIRWRGKVLTGKHAHWCFDYDQLPVDETCDEWPCSCADALEKAKP